MTEIIVRDPNPIERIVGDSGALTVDGVKQFQQMARAIRKLQSGEIEGDTLTIATAKTPASASDAGTAGQIAWDGGYIYVCVATDTWKRAALSTW